MLQYLDVEEFGLSRFTWNEEHVGSNPAFQTKILYSKSMDVNLAALISLTSSSLVPPTNSIWRGWRNGKRTGPLNKNLLFGSVEQLAVRRTVNPLPSRALGVRIPPGPQIHIYQ